ncbi:hypothetical protein ARMGADRAFT_1037759 [Armillaria gallica]|uniref:Uncharacterized protein n=1 Tax=Armillaria gallica TaxID=47427 RepID=A0A2H3D3H6_ARMGA|nr:hypothetical protein ARMGADRAFT_1037759 [Armillaria gallica]
MSAPHHSGILANWPMLNVTAGLCHAKFVVSQGMAITTGTLVRILSLEYRFIGAASPHPFLPNLPQRIKKTFMDQILFSRIHLKRHLFRSDNQHGIRKAVLEGHINPADIPPSAQTVKSTSNASATSIPSQKKRMTLQEVVTGSQRPAPSSQ